MIEELRQRLRALERPLGLEDGAAAVPLGIPEVDRVLGGGLACGALHEVSALGEAHLPSATGFVAGLCSVIPGRPPQPEGRRRTSPESIIPAAEYGFRARGLMAAPRNDRVVWLAEDMGLAESGALYGPGLESCGIPPERLLTVVVAHRRDLLWAMEEALRCRSVRVVVGEMRAGALDGVAVRRLSLAAAESGALAILLRAAPPEDASTATTRWLVGAAPPPGGGEERPPHFTAHLTRNRHGSLRSWILTWSDGHGFQCAAHAQPLAAAAADRPHRAVA
jgi:protein ImuA